jgi:hypothetical protein
MSKAEPKIADTPIEVQIPQGWLEARLADIGGEEGCISAAKRLESSNLQSTNLQPTVTVKLQEGIAHIEIVGLEQTADPTAWSRSFQSKIEQLIRQERTGV